MLRLNSLKCLNHQKNNVQTLCPLTPFEATIFSVFESLGMSAKNRFVSLPKPHVFSCSLRKSGRPGSRSSSRTARSESQSSLGSERSLKLEVVVGWSAWFHYRNLTTRP